MITLGGNAELELVDSLDPFSEGIIFSVMPPKKSWKNISNLSGGEKTLSSLALVFALHVFKVSSTITSPFSSNKLNLVFPAHTSVFHGRD
jgi:chromosome segregation ATPase